MGKKYGWRWHLSDAPSSFSKNRSTNPSRPWSRRLRAEKSQIPGAKEGSRTGVTQTEFPVSERDRDTGLVNFLHVYIFLPKEKQVLSSVISIDYIICTWIMLQKAERDGPEASNEDRKKNMIHSPTFPFQKFPKLIDDLSSETLCSYLSWHMATRRTNYQWSWHQADQAPNQTPPEVLFSLDLPGFCQLPRKSQKKRQIPPPNLPANEAKGSSLKEKQHVSLIAGTKTTVAPAFLLSTRISPALGNLRC